MKNNILILAVALPGLGYAQNYTVESLSPLGAASFSQGGRYTLTQYATPSAGVKMSGGTFGLAGDCSAIALLQTPGAPVLSIRLVGRVPVLSWLTDNSRNFVLEESTTLTPPLVWVLSEGPVLTDGKVRNAAIPPTAGKFYRLREIVNAQSSQ